MIGATGGPGAAAVGGAAEPERDVFSLVAEAGEVRRVAVGTKRDRGIAAEIVRARARDRGVIRECGNAGNEATRQGGRPRLAAVESRVDAAAIVVVPVVVAGAHVARVRGLHRERRLVLGCGVAADVDHRDRARAAGAEPAGAQGRAWVV